jgi:catechol 2,3-dioxygenase-like lactoylglutathione lyase family enzyme
LEWRQQVSYKPHHIAISVRKLEKSQEFYEMLGYEQVYRYDELDGSLIIVHLKLDSSFLEVWWHKKNKNAESLELEHGNNLKEIGVKHIGLRTDNVGAALADMKKRGFAPEDTEIKFGRTEISYFFIKDPDGVWVEIVQDDRNY